MKGCFGGHSGTTGGNEQTEVDSRMKDCRKQKEIKKSRTAALGLAPTHKSQAGLSLHDRGG